MSAVPERLAVDLDEFRASRAPEISGSSSREKNEVPSSSSPEFTRATFDAIVEPLERKQGRRLAGQNRDDCFAAGEASPEGFRLIAADALERGRLPLGLLVRMVADGDHLLDTPAAPFSSLEQRMREKGEL